MQKILFSCSQSVDNHQQISDLFVNFVVHKVVRELEYHFIASKMIELDPMYCLANCYRIELVLMYCSVVFYVIESELE